MTDSIIGEFYKKNLTMDEFGLICPRVECEDGFSMSVQTETGTRPFTAYATKVEGVTTHWEVGFPSEKEDLLMPYVEDAEVPTETVYAYVPVAIVDEIIRKHGGLKSE